jgi:STE24 endopeptidase
MTDEEIKELRAKKYTKAKRIISVAGTIIFTGLIVYLIISGLTITLKNIAYSYTSNDYIAVLIFLGIIGAAESIISLPMDFYSGYILEHKYELSNQTVVKYFIEKLKGFALGLVIGIPLLLIFYFILSHHPQTWWFIFGIILFIFSIILGRLAPTLIMPLFYKFKPLENEDLKERIMKLSEDTGVKVNGIYTFDMSKNTKKANAAFTGIGKSKRIILGDTLLEKFSADEIEMVLAHEMGHYSKKHIIKLMTVSTILTFTGLYLTSVLYTKMYSVLGYTGPADIAALPLLFLILSIYGLVTSPLTNILSRKFEWEADSFALEATKNKIAFITTMKKLADQNLAEKKPNKIIEFLFHSHPSIEKRIEFGKNYVLK